MVFMYVCVCVCCICVCVYIQLRRKGKVMFGGKFKRPIADAIAASAEHIVCVSTGVGLGPLLGFAQEVNVGVCEYKCSFT